MTGSRKTIHRTLIRRRSIQVGTIPSLCIILLSFLVDQADFDPFNADAGNGKFSNGSWVSPPNPTTVYSGWNTTFAQKWLQGLANKPTIVTIDNEIEIASSTHQDMHPVYILQS